MAGFEHLLNSFDVADELDAIASSEPPAYLRRCFAEGISSPELSLVRIQQIAVCGMVLDSVLHDRDYAAFEPELIADWRMHYAAACMHLRDSAGAALRRALDMLRRQDASAEAAAELEELTRRLAPP